MTRIVAGAAGSLTLKVPKSGTRPTSDRVREAVFSALDASGAVRGAAVVDLYAGSGALGLEAASRGAASVVLVERNAAAAAVCRQNAAALSRAVPGAKVETIASSVSGFLDSGHGAPFDLVFIDPPYDLTEAELGRALASVAELCSPDAVVVVERSTRSPEPTWPPSLEPVRRRAYGETAVWTAGISNA